MITNRSLDQDIEITRLEIKLLQFRVLLLKDHIQIKEYDPNQPRAPSGDSNGGRWVERDDNRSINVGRKPIPNSRYISLAKNSEAYCDEQYKRDVFQCKMVGLRGFYAQAMVRLVACEQGKTIPPLNY